MGQLERKREGKLSSLRMRFLRKIWVAVLAVLGIVVITPGTSYATVQEYHDYHCIHVSPHVTAFPSAYRLVAGHGGDNKHAYLSLYSHATSFLCDHPVSDRLYAAAPTVEVYTILKVYTKNTGCSVTIGWPGSITCSSTSSLTTATVAHTVCHSTSSCTYDISSPFSIDTTDTLSRIVVETHAIIGWSGGGRAEVIAGVNLGEYTCLLNYSVCQWT
jgi:hypothetical protein